MRTPGIRQYLPPDEIYKRSFSRIHKDFGDFTALEDEMLIRTRIAHTSADVDFSKTFVFHPDAISAGIEALKNNRNIITDVSMVVAGIRARLPEDFSGKLQCFLYDDWVAAEAKRTGSTKSAVALASACDDFKDGIVAIGNAPTALFELIDLIGEGKAKPALVVGIPVGFVGAAESKQELINLDIPFIANPGRRGGSPLAAAVVNGLIHLAFS